MKIFILLFIIIVLPVFSFAQDGANAKKPSVEGAKDEIGNEKSVIEEDQINENYEEKIYLQPFRQELFEIIKLFLPEENSSESTLDWQTVNDINSIIWDQIRTYNDFNIKYGRFKIQGGDWDINLSGESGGNGASSVSFGFGFNSYGIGGGEIDCNESLDLEYWIPIEEIKYKLLKKHDCYVSEGSGLYEIKIPGKKIVWVWTSYSSGSRSGSTNIGFYFDKEEALELDNY